MSSANQTARAGLGHWAKSMIAHHNSTMRALFGGVYDRDATISEILRHRDFGLGTFDHLDAETVILDGHPDLFTINVAGRTLK